MPSIIKQEDKQECTPLANSLADLDEFQTFLEIALQGSASEFTDTQKTAALLFSPYLLSNYVNGRLGGTKLCSNSNLEFPRKDCTLEDGTIVVGVPLPIREAFMWFAVKVLLQPNIVSSIQNSTTGERRVEVDGLINVEYQKKGEGADMMLDYTNIIESTIERLLEPYLTGESGMIPVVQTFSCSRRF